MSLIPWRHKRDEGVKESESGAPLDRFRGETEGLFDRFFGDPWLAGTFGPLSRLSDFEWGPRLDLSESSDAVTMKIELPGVDPEDVDVNVSGNMLTIGGQKKQEKTEKDENYHYAERQHGSFQRTVQLPSTVDPDKVKATFKNGVLTVKLKKHADAKAKRIPVKAG